MADRAEPIPADLSEAFQQAVNALIAWDGAGEEPTVTFNDRPTPISAVARLAEPYQDTMPTKLYWRLVHQANSFAERRAHATQLSKDSSFSTGAYCLLQWIEYNKSRPPDGTAP